MTKYQLHPPVGVDIYSLCDWWMIKAKGFAAENEGLQASFKNFHRLLCERFGYGHDDVDWERDQLSLIEWIAKRAAHEPGASPFDRAAILAAPRERRISMSFETQEQYEAALVFLDMADAPLNSKAESCEHDWRDHPTFLDWQSCSRCTLFRRAALKSNPEPSPCEHLRSELLVEKRSAEPPFEMRKCLDCTKIFRVRKSQRTNV